MLQLFPKSHFSRVFILCLSIFMAANGAIAQITAPQLTAISRTSSATLTAGSPVTVNFAITAGTDTLSFVSIFFQDAAGQERQMVQGTPSNGTGSIATATSWLNGSYTFTRVVVATTSSGTTTYFRNGTVTNSTTGVSGPTTHALSFSALDFSLSGGTSTIVAPLLTSITRTSAATLAAGNPVTFSFAITAGSDTLSFVSLFFQDSAGQERQIVQGTPSSGSGTIATAASWLNGNYTFNRAVIATTSSGTTTYFRNGTVTNSASGVTGPTTHSLSFSGLDFSLTSGTGSIVAPQLTAFNRTSASTLSAGSSVAVSFAITSGSDSLSFISVFFQDAAGQERQIVQGTPSNGTGNIATAASWLSGNYTFTRVVIATTSSGTTTYFRNGTITNSATGASGPTTHSISFVALDFALTGGIDGPPVIVTQPTAQTATAGQGATFSVTASSTLPLNYQWRKDGAAITGATSATLTLSNLLSGDAGAYSVAISNSAGTTTSNPATLTVNPAGSAPVITAQPTNQTATIGFLAQFSVTATPFLGVTYQWYKNGAAISGATGFLYTINNTTSADAGSYTVVVTNGAGSVTSSAATLTVIGSGGLAPTISGQPTDQSVAVGFLTFLGVTASGAQPLAYQWYKGGVAIAGATTMFFTVSASQASDAGTYTVVVSNSFGSVTSSAATVRVGNARPGTRSKGGGVSSTTFAPDARHVSRKRLTPT